MKNPTNDTLELIRKAPGDGRAVTDRLTGREVPRCMRHAHLRARWPSKTECERLNLDGPRFCNAACAAQYALELTGEDEWCVKCGAWWRSGSTHHREGDEG